jgi:hypothetical protein
VRGTRADLPGTCLKSTVLVDVDQSMSCMREETVGPTLPVMEVHDVKHAFRRAGRRSRAEPRHPAVRPSTSSSLPHLWVVAGQKF